MKKFEGGEDADENEGDDDEEDEAWNNPATGTATY
jgi:hypothetical protein